MKKCFFENKLHKVPDFHGWKSVFFFASLFCVLVLLGVIVLSRLGVINGGDSASYIELSSQRDPLYPLYLQFVKNVIYFWGLERVANWLWWVCVTQIVISAYAFVSATRFVDQKIFRELHLKVVVRFFAVGSIVATILLISMLPLFLEDKYIFPICILSEGLTIPLFLMWFITLCNWAIERTAKSALGCILLVITLISMRSQMIFCAVTAFLIVLWVCYRQKRYYRKLLLKLAIIVVATLMCISFIDHAYMLNTQKVWKKHESWVAHTGLCVLLYTSKYDDALLYKDSDLRELFIDIYQECTECGLLRHNLPEDENWFEVGEHFKQSFDKIGYEVVIPQIEKYLEASDSTDSLVVVCEKLNRPLVSQNLALKASVYFSNFIRGMIGTVAPIRRQFIAFAAFLYIIWLAMYIYIAYRKDIVAKRLKVVTTISMIVILLNCGSVCLFEFAMFRYLCYGFYLFYISAIIMGVYVLSQVRLQIHI